MGLPKKNNIKIYKDKELTPRRQELLDLITKSDTYLPDSILHDDLDYGMLEFVKQNLQVISDGVKIPIIPKILTIQRWGEITNEWEFSDEDGNIKIPFISVIRKPDAQPGTNPSIQYTVPDRRQFFYSSIKTWNGSQMGADIYKIPQPVPIDISFDVTIVCHKFRDLNRFNKLVLEKFSSRQAYTTIKGHYIPIILDNVSDKSPIDTSDGRKFYLQSYEFTMLGFLIDSEEFEVKPAVSRLLLLSEFMSTKKVVKTTINKNIEVTVVKFIGDGMQTSFSVGETIGFLFYVTINGLVQEQDLNFYHISGTSKITFVDPPIEGSEIYISYYSGINNTFIDSYGKVINLKNEYFTYDGSTLVFTLQNSIDTIIYLNINGLIDEEGNGYAISNSNEITLLIAPVIGSIIGISYMY